MALTLARTKKAAVREIGSCHPIAYVRGQSDLDGQSLYLNPDAHEGDSRVMLPVSDHFSIEPTHREDDRDLVYVTGASGSGKSHTLRAFAVRYRQLWPRRTIALISHLKEDETLDSVADRIGMRRISCESLLQRPLTIDECRDSLVMIDDIDGLDKLLAEAVHKAVMTIATEGRHENASMLYSTHSTTMGAKSRVLLNEMHSYVCFPHGASAMATEYLLHCYAGVDKDVIKQARKLRSRWFMISKRYPPYMLYDGGCQLLNSE